MAEGGGPISSPKGSHAPPGLPIGALALRAELTGGKLNTLARLSADDVDVEVAAGSDSLWVLMRRRGLGGLALRTAYAPGGVEARLASESDRGCVARVETVLGRFEVRIDLPRPDAPMLRAVTELTPVADLLVPFLPRDLYPIDDKGDPARTTGVVEAAQRGVNGGVLYFRMQQPAFGNVLYFQNLTALNPYFAATGTKPDGVVGGEWPELGYQPPTAPLGASPPVKPLKAGKTVTISDAILDLRPGRDADEQDGALEFLDMIAGAYRLIERPKAVFRDWPARALQTAADLKRSPKASLRQYGHFYLHPYTAAEYPDSMVQVSVLASVTQFAQWRRRPMPLSEDLAAGLGRFFDKDLGTIRRYLPNVGKDKDRFAVDSWYLYHPLLNLGRMAKAGDGQARALFLDSLDYAVKAAQHFDYAWPIQYDVRDFKVLTKARSDGRGQTDVGGVYAYVMLLAADITGERRYVEEAKTALHKLAGLRFNLIYQANLSAWGAVAAARLWRETGDSWFFRQAHVFIAGLFHNSELWESRIKTARWHKNFLGVTCLHDAPYMAIYECFETFAAFDEYLELGGDDVEPAVRLLIAEYRRYALDRAWFYYPDALPVHALAKDIRNGHIDPKLSFPLEDLYGDGQLCGQVGQEIYGCGAAFVFAALSFHRPRGAPFDLFCDRRLGTIKANAGVLELRPDAPEGFTTRLSLVPRGRTPLPPGLKVEGGGRTARPSKGEHGRLDFELDAGGGPILIRWDRGAK